MKTNSRYEIENAKKAYNRAKNKVKSYSRKLRKQFEDGIAERAKQKGNNKEVFAYINSRTKSKKRIGKICKNPDEKSSEKKQTMIRRKHKYSHSSL